VSPNLSLLVVVSLGISIGHIADSTSFCAKFEFQFRHHLRLSGLRFETEKINSETKLAGVDNRPVSWPSLIKFGLRIGLPENRPERVPPPLKLGGENVPSRLSYIYELFDFIQSLNAQSALDVQRLGIKGQCIISSAKTIATLSITQPGIALLRSNFEQTLITCHLMYYKCSRSRGQRSRSQRDIAYRHKNPYMSGTDRLTEFKLSENYTTASSREKCSRSYFKHWNRNNCKISAAYFSSSLRFGPEFHHITSDTLKS